MKKILVLITLQCITLLLSNKSFSQVVNTYQYDNVVNTGSKTSYKDGISKIYYIENGISVTNSLTLINQYGKYYQINLEIENLTGGDIIFNPDGIIALMTNYKTDRKTKVVSIDSQTKGQVLSSADYMKKVQRRQNIQSALSSMAGQYNAEQAGYSYSTTTTAISGRSNTYGSVNNYYTGQSVNYRGSTSVSGVGVSKTASYNGQAAYQAKKEAQREAQQMDNELYEIRSELNQKYLKINTIEHQQRLKGAINLVYEKTDRLEILVPVNGKYYSFVYADTQENSNQEVPKTNPKTNYSNNPTVNELYTQSISNFNNKNYLDGLKDLDKALKIEPDNIYLLSSRGTLKYYYLNLKQEGIEDIKAAVNFDLTNINKYQNLNSLCSMYMSEKELDKVYEMADQMVKLKPNEMEGYYNRAYANSAFKKHYESINDLQKIISISQNRLNSSNILGPVYNSLGYEYILLKDYDKALPLINKALEMIPNYSYVWGSRGQLYYEIGDYKKCIADMTTAIDLVEKGNDQGGMSSDPSVPYYYRALSNINKGKGKESCFDLSKAIELGNKEAVEVFNQNCK